MSNLDNIIQDEISTKARNMHRIHKDTLESGSNLNEIIQKSKALLKHKFIDTEIHTVTERTSIISYTMISIVIVVVIFVCKNIFPGETRSLIYMRNVAKADANQPVRFELRRPRPEVEAIEAANVILPIEYRQQ